MMDFFRWINSYFYGDQWYIYWGVVAILVVIALCIQVPKLVKSLKEAKTRGEK